MRNFILFAASCCLLTAITTIIIHSFPYVEMSFDERAMLYDDSTYFVNRIIIIIHCLLFAVAMFGVCLTIHKRVLAFSGLGLLLFLLFSITEIVRQLLLIFYLNGLRKNYIEADNAVSKEVLKISIENFGFINYTLYTIFILSFGLGAICYGLGLLQIKSLKYTKWLGTLMLVWGIGSFLAFGNVFWNLNWMGALIEPYNLYYQSLIRILIALWLYLSYRDMLCYNRPLIE